MDGNIRLEVVASATLVGVLRILERFLFGMDFLVAAQARLMLESFTALNYVANESSCVCEYR